MVRWLCSIIAQMELCHYSNTANPKWIYINLVGKKAAAFPLSNNMDESSLRFHLLLCAC